MNEVIVNTQDIESAWEKDNICFVKMRSGKIWLCKQFFDVDYWFYTDNGSSCDLIINNPFGTSKIEKYICNTFLLLQNKRGLVSIPLSKGKRECNG